MKQSKLILALAALLFSGVPSCARLSAECEDFFMKTPFEQSEARFRTYPIERQLDLYLCGMKVHPPAIGFAYIIAERGEDATPFIVAKLKSVNDEKEQDDLIYILEVMSNRGHLHGRGDIIDEIRQVVMRMRVDIIRERSLEALRKIEANSR